MTNHAGASPNAPTAVSPNYIESKPSREEISTCEACTNFLDPSLLAVHGKDPHVTKLKYLGVKIRSSIISRQYWAGIDG